MSNLLDSETNKLPAPSGSAASTPVAPTTPADL